jgi:hypothetical protein
MTKQKSINLFAILIVSLVAGSEGIGQVLFEKSYPPSSSVSAALSLTDRLHDNSDQSGICHLDLYNDASGSHVSRVVGLEGKYGSYGCG